MAGRASAQDGEDLADGSASGAEPDHGDAICVTLHDLWRPVRVRNLMEGKGGDRRVMGI